MFLGGKGGDSVLGFKNCSVWYWILFAIQFPIYAGIFIAIKKYIDIEVKIKDEGNHEYKEYETNISKIGLHKFLINGFGCGFIIGLVGFGGSLMIVPVMVVMGLHPRAATASTSFLTIFNSGMTVIIALLGG